MRAAWHDLSGPSEFAFDDADEGVDAGWARGGTRLDRTITVPFPPESPASGIADTGYHRVLWYRCTGAADEIAALGHDAGRRLLLHFGAVDHRADVWIDGIHVARHEGGHVPFTAVVPTEGDGFEIVARAEDDPHDLSQPRGKQEWELEPHAIWYHRTSGIWQPVWLESVARQHVARVVWRASAATAEVRLDLELAERPVPGTRARVTLRRGATTLARVEAEIATTEPELVLSLPVLRSAQAVEAYLWSPESPTLIDAEIELHAPGADTDVVASLPRHPGGRRGGRSLPAERPTLRGARRALAGLLARVASRRPERRRPAGRGRARQGARVHDRPRASEDRGSAIPLLGRPDRTARLDRAAERVRVLGDRHPSPLRRVDRRRPPRSVASEHRRVGADQRELGRAVGGLRRPAPRASPHAPAPHARARRLAARRLERRLGARALRPAHHARLRERRRPAGRHLRRRGALPRGAGRRRPDRSPLSGRHA